jgi:hypothetical protein
MVEDFKIQRHGLQHPIIESAQGASGHPSLRFVASPLVLSRSVQKL